MTVHTYSRKILDHCRNPRNRGELATPSAEQEGSNGLCGDRVRIQLKIMNDVVIDAKFYAEACAVCVAAASYLTVLVRGAPLDEVETLEVDDIRRSLDAGNLPHGRFRCLGLPLTLMHAAVVHYRSERPEPTVQ